MNSVLPSESCPYLGLSDDPDTALSYPSPWNHCYRAKPPASVKTSHQAEVCLTRNHLDCIVYLNERARPLPAELRGERSGKRIWILVLLISLLLAALWLGRSYLPILAPATSPATRGIASTEFPLSTDTSTATPTNRVNPAAAAPFETFTPISSSTLTPSVCGHALDVPFGTTVKMVIHLVTAGETLDIYSRNYQTSAEAIAAINYDMLVPLWEDWVIVIPIGVTDTRGIPPFDKYQTAGERLSVDDMAATLNTDLQLFKQFNAFDETCEVFNGWVLAPRARP